MQVPFFDYPSLFRQHEADYTRIILDVCRRGAFILQKEVAEFENNFATYLGVTHAIGVSDATNALALGMRAVGIGPGDEVIFPSHTFVATAGAINLVGAKPVAADIGWDGLLDTDSVKQKITSRTKAIIPVQLNGRVADMPAIQKVADHYGIMIIEDSAQALGAKLNEKCAGTFGIFGAFSFYPAKSLGCFGDGGAVVTNDDEVARKVRLMRDHGRSAMNGVEMWGTNSRLDNLHAAILDFRLSSFDDEIIRRREIASRYQEALGKIYDLILPPAPGSEPYRYDTFQNYEMQAGKRDELRNFLSDRGIGTTIQWGGKAVHQFKNLHLDISLPKTEEFFTKCMMLPMNTLLTDDQIEYICNTVREFYNFD